MKAMKNRGGNKPQGEPSPEPDSMEVIFRVQMMLLWNHIICLKSFFASFAGTTNAKEDSSCPFHYTPVTKTVHMAYKFRLTPDDEQKEFLAKHFGCVIWVYNHYLSQRKELYEKNGQRIEYEEQSKDLKVLKKQPETSWLDEVNSQSIQQALRCLDTAFKNFFSKKARFPKYHSKYHKNSFAVPQNAKIEDGLLWLPKFKSGIPIIMHREIQGKVGKVTISKTSSGEYYASFYVKEERVELEPSCKAVGLDLGLKDLVIVSDGRKFDNNKYLRKYERKLARAQKHLSRKKKGSKGYEKQRLKVARIHQKIQNCRKDYQHKCTRELVRNYGIICIENLNVKGMIKNPKLSKSIADASWGAFVTMLKYKAKWYGRIVVEIPRFFPSTQTCHKCGYINKATKDLKVRQWDCPVCGTHHDRDLNASIVIRDIGLKKLWSKVKNKNHKVMA